MYIKGKKYFACLIAIIFLLTQLFISPAFSQSLAQESEIGSKTTSVSATITARIAGADRYQTAAAVSQEGWETSDYAVLTRGDHFADALCAGPLAHKYGGPILLTGPNQLNGDTLTELQRLGVKHLFIAGGAGVVSQSVEDALKVAGIATIERIYGADRYETSAKIAEKIGSTGKEVLSTNSDFPELDVEIGSPVVIATGENYPDALSISSFAASNGWPILFSKGGSIPQSVKEYLEMIKPSHIYIIGGAGAVSALVEAEIAAHVPTSEIIRFSGKDRYETSLLIAKEFAPNPPKVFVASGQNFPDALAGGVLAAQTSDPVILIHPDTKNDLPADFKLYLENRDLQAGLQIICLGGYGAVSIHLEKLLKGEIIVNPYVKYSYEQMLKDVERIQRAYPEIVELGSIGQSVENREHILIKLGKGEHKVFLNGSFHAREYITTTFLMKMIDEYAYAYYNKEHFGMFDVNMLLDSATLYIVPMVNPDGVNLVQNGINTVEDPRRVRSMRLLHPNLGFASWKANINGVDLNQNFPVGWNVKVTNTNVPSSENYKGLKPMTEPEAKAVMNLVESNDFKIIASYHSQGEDIFWSDKNCSSFNHILEPMADRLVRLTGYKKGPKVHDPGNWGSGIADWARLQKILTFTLELCPYLNNLPYPDSRFDDVWERVKETGLFFAQEAVNMN
ncbi:MAG: hypothetical protein APF84_04090 [Gracilibacter sp. BRH_c7a]|nr:MAG: hypothetical protein APF84_04090 [Gracilibacter sp. BRH_c7a]